VVIPVRSAMTAGSPNWSVEALVINRLAVGADQIHFLGRNTELAASGKRRARKQLAEKKIELARFGRGGCCAVRQPQYRRAHGWGIRRRAEAFEFRLKLWRRA
jgi:hypothetical protein